MARPVWTPTDAQRRQAETMAAYGIPEADIARVLGVSKPTLRKHCGTDTTDAGKKAPLQQAMQQALAGLKETDMAAAQKDATAAQGMLKPSM